MLTSNRGFTLIEVLLVLAILGILLAIVTPYLGDMQQKQQINSEAQAILQNLNRSRSEAAKRNSQVAMTFFQPINGTTYDYVVYVDSNRNFEYDAGEEVIAEILLDYGVAFDTTQGGGDGISIINNDDALPSLAWNSRGQPRTNGNALGSGTIYLVGSTGITRSLIISTAGRIRIP